MEVEITGSEGEFFYLLTVAGQPDLEVIPALQRFLVDLGDYDPRKVVVKVVLTGRIDHSVSEDLARVFELLLANRLYKIIVNLKAVTHMDSDGIQPLLGTCKRCKVLNRGRFVLSSLSTAAQRRLDMAGMLDVRCFAIAKNDVEAEALFRASSIAIDARELGKLLASRALEVLGVTGATAMVREVVMKDNAAGNPTVLVLFYIPRGEETEKVSVEMQFQLTPTFWFLRDGRMHHVLGSSNFATFTYKKDPTVDDLVPEIAVDGKLPF